MFDAHKNFAQGTVLTAPVPATTGVTIVLQAGHGALFPATPFNATLWPGNTVPNAANAEVVRVTAIVGDTLTVTRAQEGTTGKVVVAGFQIAQTMTAVNVQSIEKMLSGKLYYVNKNNGSDATGTPFLTIAAAVAVAISGDTIIVMPGTYNENKLMKAGVAFHFMPGAVIDYQDPGSISTSVTSLLIGLGAKTLTVGAGLTLQAGDFVSINLYPNTTDPDVGGNDWQQDNMVGTVTSYIGTTLIVNITSINGGGTFAHWLVFGPSFGIFDDRVAGAAGLLQVTGSLDMVYRAANPPNFFHALGAVVCNNALTQIKFEGKKNTLSAPVSMTGGSGNTRFGMFSLQNVKNGSFVDVDEVTDDGTTWSNLDGTSPTIAPGGGTGFYWETGELHIRCRRVTVATGYGVWFHEPGGGSSTNVYFEGQLSQNKGAAGLYVDSNSGNFRVWFTSAQIIGSGLAVSLIGLGKVYVDTQKILATSGVAIASSSPLWLRAMKITSSGSGWISITGGFAQITAQELEDTSAGANITNGVAVTAGSLFLTGARITTGAASLGAVSHSGTGTTKLINCYIAATSNNILTNRPITAGGAGLRLVSCTILACALSDGSVYAAGAQTVKFTGITIATRAAHGNITQQPLASIVVDVNAGP